MSGYLLDALLGHCPGSRCLSVMLGMLFELRFGAMELAAVDAVRAAIGAPIGLVGPAIDDLGALDH